MSYQIEAKIVDREQQLLHSISNCSTNSVASNLKKKSSLSRSSRCESLESINSNNNNNNDNLPVKQHQQQQYQNQLSINSNSKHSRNSSNTSNSDSIVNSSNNNNNNVMNGSSQGSLTLNNNSSDNSKSLLVVKVNVECSDDNLSSTVYKKIFVKDSDRTKEVKKLILEKFLMSADKADKYNLLQVFADGTHPSKIFMCFIIVQKVVTFVFFRYPYKG